MVPLQPPIQERQREQEVAQSERAIALLLLRRRGLTRELAAVEAELAALVAYRSSESDGQEND